MSLAPPAGELSSDEDDEDRGGGWRKSRPSLGRTSRRSNESETISSARHDAEAVFQVTGADGELSSCNGPYRQRGLHNERPKYHNDESTAIIYWGDGSWRLQMFDDTVGWSYSSPASSDMLPVTSNRWTHYAWPDRTVQVERDSQRAAESNAAEDAPPASRSRKSSEEAIAEGVFEIRDFTAASAFERMAHRMTLGIKAWAVALSSRPTHRVEFDLGEFKYELNFNNLPRALDPWHQEGEVRERLGMHSFPARAHRLQRWFGVQHSALAIVRTSRGKQVLLDLDGARLVLSALVLASKATSFGKDSDLSPPPLACFVTVDGGKRRRHVGETVHDGWRTLFTTDAVGRVDAQLSHLDGLAAFFWRKVGADPEDPRLSLLIGARFTYVADAFESFVYNDAAGPPDTKELDVDAALAEALDGIVRAEVDPVECMQLHCQWPAFPCGAFDDNAVHSELDPRNAPFWKLRVMQAENLYLPQTSRLRTLLEFQREAGTVRSAEHSLQPQMPKTTLGSLSCALQDSFESILLPTAGQVLDLTNDCMAYPVCVRPDSTEFGKLRGAARGSRLARLAEISAGMKCFKGVLLLWCHVLAKMRKQLDELERPDSSIPSPQTLRDEAGGARTELFDPSFCLLQQKFDMLQKCIEVTTQDRRDVSPRQLPVQGVRPLVAPRLLQPALLTADLVMQRELAAAGMDATERAELHVREVRSDIAAFKAANPDSGSDDFRAWRTEVEGCSLPLPQEWLDRIWTETAAQPALEQQQLLFEPEREAEMAMDYLEHVEGLPLLAQLFRALLRLTLEELSEAVGKEPLVAQLASLRDAAVAAVFPAFADSEDFPGAAEVETAVAALEALEVGVRLAASLRAKLPTELEPLLADLLSASEATVTSPAQRRAIEELFARTERGSPSNSPHSSPTFFDGRPLSKEFLFLLQPVAESSAPHAESCRMYAEVREAHLRLAVVTSAKFG